MDQESAEIWTAQTLLQAGSFPRPRLLTVHPTYTHCALKHPQAESGLKQRNPPDKLCAFLADHLANMALALYNSLTRRVEPFVPNDPEQVTMYVCGPTVYHYVHIGNARGPVVFDVLARLLRQRYPKLIYARNITDVDDKINAAAASAGVPIGTITDKYAAIFHADMARLGVAPPDVEPHATAHIGAILQMCETLIDTGHAYVAANHVLFDVASFASYGQLSGRSPDEMLAGVRIDVAPYKKNAADFVLWKPSTPEQPGWDSPWGRGRPGWHIECSAMAAAHLGETIDIHAGGVDLVFPHHENEIAQSVCAHGGKPFARFWLHNGMLTFAGAKMSKSLGNVKQLHTLLAQYPPEALRYALLSAHYRQPLEWSDGLIEQATTTLDRLYGTLRQLAAIPAEPAGSSQPIAAALDDDLNTPAALAALNQLAAQARQLAVTNTVSDDAQRTKLTRIKVDLLACGKLLGLLQQDPETWFKHGVDVDAATVEGLIEQRRAARSVRDFTRADGIRKQLADMGVTIEDGPDGTRWKVAHA